MPAAAGRRGGGLPKAVATAVRPSPKMLTAYVLHRYDWSESSLILDLYTREQGRLVVAAKGAKRPYSQLRSVLLPFQRLQVAVGKVPRPRVTAAVQDEPPLNLRASSGDVQNLRAAEWAGGAAMPTGAALFSGFYLNELLMKLTSRQEPSTLLFDVYAETLAEITAVGEMRVQAALRAFELVLLREAGLLADLSVVATSQAPVSPDGRYALLADAGLVERCDDAASRAQAAPAIEGRVWIGIQAALLHGSLAALHLACGQALQALRPALRGLLYHHLGTSLLHTRQVSRDVQALA